MPFELVRNDITRMKTDAIVNAANSSLTGGGGVDGAIHRAAGPELLDECLTLGGCRTGEAKSTRGYRLPARYVIHTVGPVWEGGNRGERELLTACYRNSLLLAESLGCESVAFPLISAGAYGYPAEEALRVASETIRGFLRDHEMMVYLVIFSRSAYMISKSLYADIRAYIGDEAAWEEYERAEALRRQQILKNRLRRSAEGQEEEDQSIRKYNVGMPPSYAKPEQQPQEHADGFVLGEAVYGAAPDREAYEEALRNYLKRMDEGFRDMLLRMIDERRMTDAECYRKANVDRKLFSKIKNQPEYKPGKTTVLAFAVALELSLEETRKMLETAGYSLSRSSRSDMIVEFFIRRGIYDIDQINLALFSFDEKLLGSMTM